MEEAPSAASTMKRMLPFAKGQIWRVRDVNVAVTQVGNVAAHRN